MEARARYRALASVCILLAAIFALGKWRLLSLDSPSEASREGTSQAQKFATQRPTPKLPAPSFLKFEVAPIERQSNVDIADDGSVLEVVANPDSQTRIYTFRPPIGRPQKISATNPTDRYAISQRGKLFKFQLVQTGFGSSRRSGFRLIVDQLFASSPDPIGSPRRFLESGASIRYKATTNNRGVFYLFKEREPETSLFESKHLFSLAEVDDLERIWIWELRTTGKTRQYYIYCVNNPAKAIFDLPEVEGTPKLVTSTGQKTVVTMRSPAPGSRHRSFVTSDGKWKEILPPTGFDGILIQRLTSDGLMFGTLQVDQTTLVPTVWKDGVAYDLRRHAKWPLGGELSYIETANRRGDLIVSSMGSPVEGGYYSVLLRRSAPK